MTANRVRLALEGQKRRRAGRLYGEVLAYLAETPHIDDGLRDALARCLAYLDSSRAPTAEGQP